MPAAFPQPTPRRQLALRWAARLLACAAALAGPANASAAGNAACTNAQRIVFTQPVTVTAQERAQIAQLSPLRVLAVSAPPLSQYEEETGRYRGVAIDVLCAITQELGLDWRLDGAPTQTVTEKIAKVQNGQADLFLPLSATPERERLGHFTLALYTSYYVAIARKGRSIVIDRAADLARYRVGLVRGVALQPILEPLVPAAQLLLAQQSFAGGGLFDALRAGDIDVAVFSRDFFVEQRYNHELFDLEIVHTFKEYPRHYGFYLGPDAAHLQLATLLDRYLGAIDTSASLRAHQMGERQLIERYLHQRQQRLLLLISSAGAAVLALAAFIALRHYRQLTQRLEAGHRRIRQQQQALQAANHQLQQLSQTDALTGLANRRMLDQSLAREHARWRRTGSALSVALIDIDHFKQVNDRLGHTTGDAYLRAVAGVLARSLTRVTDLAARYGGEEFLCLLPDSDAHAARTVAERIMDGIAALQLPNPRAGADAGALTVSIGLVTLQSGSHGTADLLQQADVQLYAAKHAGRNRIQATTLRA